MDVPLPDASPVHPEGDGQWVTGRAGLVNSLIQGEDHSNFSGLKGQIGGLL